MIARLRQRYSVPHEPLRSERRLELAVVVLALVVVVQLPILFGRYIVAGQVRAVPPAPDSLTVVTRAQLDTLTAQQSQEVLARPVFFSSRRPLEPLQDLAPADIEADSKKAGSLEGLKVLGIVENGEKSRVIVSFKGAQQRLRKGESIEGWRLTEVRPGRVVLESGDERDERRMSPMPVIVAASTGESVGDPAEESATLPGASEVRRAIDGADDKQRQQQQGKVRRALSAGGAPITGQSGN